MLVGPGRVSTGSVNDAEDGVGANKIPRVNRRAAFSRVADQFLGIDGGNATVGEGGPWRATVYLGLVDVDAFFIFSGGASGRRAWSARTGCEAVTGRLCGSIKIPRISDVIVDAG